MARRKARKRPYQQPPNEVVNKRPASERADSGRRRSAPQRGKGRDARPVEPPSWRRVIKRTPIAFMLFVGLVYLFPPSVVDGDTTTPERLQIAVFQALIMALVFIPMSYILDRFIYRSYRRRVEAAQAAPATPDQPDVIDAEAVDTSVTEDDATDDSEKP